MTKRTIEAPDPSEIKDDDEEDIDFSDIAEFDETFWQRFKLVKPDRTAQFTSRIKQWALNQFEASRKGIRRVLVVC